MGNRRVGLVVGVVAAVLSAAAASGAGAASAAPTRSGPLVPRWTTCADGSHSSTGWSCSWWLELLPAETNATEDYSVYWVELGIEPSPGWCARSISFSAEFPSTARVVSVVPADGERFQKARTVTTELLVDAEGRAPVPGHVEEDARIGAGRTRVSWGPSHYTYRWRGRHGGRVYAVVGLQIAGDRIPPHLTSAWAEGAGFGVGPCEEATIRTGR